MGNSLFLSMFVFLVKHTKVKQKLANVKVIDYFIYHKYMMHLVNDGIKFQIKIIKISKKQRKP